MRSKVKLKESRPGTKDKSGKGAAGKKLGSRSPPRKDGKGGKGKEYAEVAVQDEGGDPASALVEENKLKTPGTRQSRRSRSNLAPVDELDGYDDCFDLDDEQSWSTVAKDQLQGRFSQYRRICRLKLQEAEEQRQLTVAKTQRKVQLLKAQFVEHKTKWEMERKVLIDQVEQAQSLQGDAEKEADQAMTQLEDFITEQERLEEEEEVRRSAILSGPSGSASLTPGNLTPTGKTPSPAAGASAQATPRESRTAQHSDELQKLMQQTDDAKSQRQAGTEATPSPSNTPGVMGALLDVTRVPVHGRKSSESGSPRSPANQSGSQTPTASQHASPVIVEAPLEPSEQAVDQVMEVVESVEDVQVVGAEEVAVEEEVLSAQEGIVSAQEAVVFPELLEQNAVPTLDLRPSSDQSPREGGELFPDLPADLPVIMLMGHVTPASVLAPRGPGSGHGSRSVPASRQAKRVLILQPKSVPASAPLRRGAPTRATADPASSSQLSSAGSLAPKALETAAHKVATETPFSPSPLATAPPSAALQREVTTVQEEAGGDKREVQDKGDNLPTPGAVSQESTEDRAVTLEKENTVLSAAKEKADTPLSEGKKKEATVLSTGKEDTDVEKKGEEVLATGGEGQTPEKVEGGKQSVQEQTAPEADLTPEQVGGRSCDMIAVDCTD